MSEPQIGLDIISHYDLYGIINEDVFLTFEEAKVALEKANAIEAQ